VIKSVFCAHPETIQHLFFECHFAKFIWSTIQITFNIHMHVSVLHLFSVWTTSLGQRMRKFVLIGAAILCWVLWTSRNNIVFDNSPIKTYMQILYHRTYWSDSGHNYKGVRRRQQ
jgi:hypothetical protein